MIRWLTGACVSLAMLSGMAMADSNGPTTKPSDHFPTPAELVAKLKAQHQTEASTPKVAYFALGSGVVEKPADFSLFGGDAGVLTLRNLIDRLETARQDPQVRSVLITMDGASLNLSQAIELRDELNLLRQDGKRTFVYADEYETGTYIAASGATDVCMLEGGDIMVPGVGFETMFAKGLLDRVGVKADYVQIGEYKGADEEYTRSEPSPELKGELNKLADSLYGQIVDAISLDRNMSVNDVKELVDESIIPGNVAKNRGLVDHLCDIDDLRGLIDDEMGQKMDLVNDYGADPKPQLDLSSPFALFAMLNKKPVESTKPAVAIIYAEGTIVDGTGGGGLFGNSESIGSETMREALRTADRDNTVQAIVIRIDSPGGSALASEVMWQAVRRVAKDKPVIISVGSMAASGGYYLASSGDRIFADPTAIIGSIGVVGGKFVLKDLFDKLGIHDEQFLRGRNADLFSSDTEWSDRQRQQVTLWMRSTYDQFTKRVMTTRQGKIKDIDSVARGRIFSAKQAMDLGMVDQIGGVKDAIAYAASDAGMKPGTYEVRPLPAPKTLADMLGMGDDQDTAMPFTPKIDMGTAFLATLPPDMRDLMSEQLQMLVMLQQRPVVLMTPVVMQMR